jgi:hypothetical protein
MLSLLLLWLLIFLMFYPLVCCSTCWIKRLCCCDDKHVCSFSIYFDHSIWSIIITNVYQKMHSFRDQCISRTCVLLCSRCNPVDISCTHKLNEFGNYEKILRQCCSLWLSSPLSECSVWKFLVSPTFADHQPLLVPLHLWGYNHAVQKLQLLADLCTIERGSKSAFSLLASRGVTPAWRFTASVDFFKCQKKPCIFLCSSTEETWHCTEWISAPNGNVSKFWNMYKLVTSCIQCLVITTF